MYKKASKYYANTYLIVYLRLTNKMAYSKITSFEIKDQEIAMYAKSLGHPARIAILKILAKYGASMCGEIVAELPLSQSTVSQHLKELKTVGLIKGKQDGPAVSYSINKKKLAKAQKRLDKFFSKINLKLAE